MTLYYAVGGGLGHLTRAKVFLDHFGYTSYSVITPITYAYLIFPPEKIILIPQPLTENLLQYKTWIKSIISDPKYDHLIVDTFPNGVIGELLPALTKNKKVTYVSRRLKWDAYAAKINPYSFDESYLLEELEYNHRSYIQKISKAAYYSQLDYPFHSLEKSWQKHLLQIKKPIWLIIHSENAEELHTLISFAKEKALSESTKPYFLVITNQVARLSQEGRVIRYYPGWAFYPYAQKIFTGCGFNSMYIPIPEGVAHHYIPFARKYDDQYWRVRNIPEKNAINFKE